MRVLPKAVFVFLTMSTLLTHQVSAYCSRCVKIEGERAKEQAEHPQSVGYYDDPISLNSSKDRSSPEKSTKTPSENPERSNNSSKNTSASPLESNLLAVSSLPQNPSSLQNRRNGDSPNRFEAPADANERPVKEDFFEEDFGENGQGKKEDSNDQSKQNKSGYFTDVHGHTVPYSAYSTLYTILKTKRFLETLDGSFTLFVPSNQALSKLPPGNLANLTKPENEEELAALVSNHIVARKILKKDFETHHNLEIKAISGKNLTLKSERGKLTIDGAEILRIEPAGYDGVIYVIDTVLR